MKGIVLLASFLGFAVLTPQKPQPHEDFGLPQLHEINTITLSPSYGCRSREEFQQGYRNTALFLSGYSRRANSPELLFNGACGAQDNLESTDLGLIADLGEISLETVTAHLFFNTKNIASFDLYSRFARRVEVKPDHTYAALLNGGEIRGMLVFTVTGYVPNQKLELKYAVKKYEIFATKAQSPGFEWEKESK